MPKQFDIFVDEYQSAEGTNQEFDIYIRKTPEKIPFDDDAIEAYKQSSYTEQKDSDGLYILNFNGRETPVGNNPYSYLERVGDIGDPPSPAYTKYYKMNQYTGTRESVFDIYICNKSINSDITIYSLPFRTTTRVNNELILSVPNDAVRNYVEQRAKVDSSFLLGTDIDTRVEQVTKVASDMVISALEKGSIEVNSGMVIDVSIGGTTLWRYRLLSDMDDSKLSVYDNVTLGDTDIVGL